jgi:drug/metabolite transporter (DMT)-like permease
LKRNAKFYLSLILIGAAWGVTFPIGKIVVSAGHQPFGILVWQQLGALLLTGAICLKWRQSLKITRQYFWLYFGVAVLGSLLSGALTYTAAAHLPAGVLAIIIALVPLFSMPIALALGYEKIQAIRLFGLGLGALAMVILVGPQASLPGVGSAFFVFLALLATLAYGAEGNFLEWFRRRLGADMPGPFQVLFGASFIGLVTTLPIALALGQFINPLRVWTPAEWGIVQITVASTMAYSGYIWLIGHTGPVFAAQVSYLVTSFGVVLSMALLGETYSGWVWLASILILCGLFLVQPKGGTDDP